MYNFFTCRKPLCASILVCIRMCTVIYVEHTYTFIKTIIINIKHRTGRS